MRRLILSPWDLAAINQVITLQKAMGFALMTETEEKDYFQEYAPKDWFFLKDQAGDVKGWIRHFPHFSTHSWVDFHSEADVSDADNEYLFQHFLTHARLEEADGFNIPMKDARLKLMLEKFNFREDLTRTWIKYVFPNLEKKSTSDWEEPQGFSFALKFSEPEHFTESQKISPFQEKSKSWHSKKFPENFIRFENRGNEILLLLDRTREPIQLVEAIKSLLANQSVQTVWTTQPIHGLKAVSTIDEVVLSKNSEV